MLRVATALYILLALFATSANAEQYNDPDGRFSVTVPNGWAADKPNAPSAAVQGGELGLFMVGVRDKQLVGFCFALLMNTPETRSMTQAEIDAALGEKLTEDAWKAGLKAAGAGDNMAVQSSGNRQGPGHRVHYVVITMDSKGNDGSITKMKGKQEYHVLPGVLHIVFCATDEAGYDAASSDFEAIFASYTPQAGVIAQAPQPAGPSVLTLYSGADFTGVARVISQDAPNVAALGLTAPTASIAVAGFGQWQACEGPNYTGTCRALRAAETAAAGRALGIGSLRRLPASAAGLAGVINAAAGRAMRATADRFRAR